jgi:uncharacterized RDD family membrane protein YckC
VKFSSRKAAHQPHKSASLIVADYLLWRNRPGQPAGFLRNYLIRDFLVGIIYGIPVVGSIFLIAEIVMLFLPARRTVRDLIANTSVVQD